MLRSPAEKEIRNRSFIQQLSITTQQRSMLALDALPR